MARITEEKIQAARLMLAAYDKLERKSTDRAGWLMLKYGISRLRAARLVQAADGGATTEDVRKKRAPSVPRAEIRTGYLVVVGTDEADPDRLKVALQTKQFKVTDKSIREVKRHPAEVSTAWSPEGFLKHTNWRWTELDAWLIAWQRAWGTVENRERDLRDAVAEGDAIDAAIPDAMVSEVLKAPIDGPWPPGRCRIAVARASRV